MQGLDYKFPSLVEPQITIAKVAYSEIINANKECPLLHYIFVIAEKIGDTVYVIYLGISSTNIYVYVVGGKGKFGNLDDLYNNY